MTLRDGACGFALLLRMLSVVFLLVGVMCCGPASQDREPRRMILELEVYNEFVDDMFGQSGLCRMLARIPKSVISKVDPGDSIAVAYMLEGDTLRLRIEGSGDSLAPIYYLIGYGLGSDSSSILVVPSFSPMTENAELVQSAQYHEGYLKIVTLTVAADEKRRLSDPVVIGLKEVRGLTVRVK